MDNLNITASPSVSPSLISALGRFVGDAVAAENESFGKESGGHHDRGEDAHNIIASMPITSMDDAAIMAIHAYGFVALVVENGGSPTDEAWIKADLDRAERALRTLALFLIEQTGIDPVANAAPYYTR